MEQTPDGNYFRDPFESFYCKILATLAYMAGLPGCCIAACFIWYEGTGRAGPFRTCVNQLVSNIYFLLISYYAIIMLADLIRVWYGPLSEPICNGLQLARHTIQVMGFLLWMVVAILKFWIVCIRKSLPTMDDDFVTTFVTIASFMLSLLYSLIGVILPQKPTLAHWVCSGIYGQYEHEGQRMFPISSFVAGLSLICNVISTFAVYFHRRKFETPKFKNRIPHSLESLGANCFIMIWIVIHAVSSIVVNTPKKGMNEFPFAYFPLEHMFIAPIGVSVFVGFVILFNHGLALKNALYQI